MRKKKYDVKLEELAHDAAMTDNEEEVIKSFISGMMNDMMGIEQPDVKDGIVSLTEAHICIVRVNPSKLVIYYLDSYGAWTEDEYIPSERAGEYNIDYGQFLFTFYDNISDTIQPITTVKVDGISKNNAMKYYKNGFIEHIIGVIMAGRIHVDTKYELKVFRKSLPTENFDV